MPFSVVINVLHRSFVVCSAFSALSFLCRCCRKRSVSGRWLKPKTVGSDLFMSVRLVSVFHRAANIWAGKIPAIRRVFLFCAYLYARCPKAGEKRGGESPVFPFRGVVSLSAFRCARWAAPCSFGCRGTIALKMGGASWMPPGKPRFRRSGSPKRAVLAGLLVVSAKRAAGSGDFLLLRL